MIFIDFSQIIMANFLRGTIPPEEDFLRHLVLTSLLSYKKQFQKQYGELVICCDGFGYMYWRKQLYPHYKMNRKLKPQTREIDWKAFYEAFGNIKNELKTYFPYKFIEVHSCEGDDVIAVLVKKYAGIEKNLIISSDKDLKQLKMFDENIKQYSVMTKQFISCDNPIQFLKEHILRGDASDGIPNYLSDDDTFVNSDKRQRTLSSKMVDEFLINEKFYNFGKTQCEMSNFNRNQMLIDLRYIPIPESNKILEQDELENARLKEYKRTGKKGQLINYFIEYKLPNLFGRIQEF